MEIVNGKPVISEIVVSGRKQPLTDIREQMLEEHQSYFRIFSDADNSSITREKLMNELQRINEYTDNHFNLDTTELKCTLKSLQRSRNVLLWHDTSTLSDHSHLLMLVKCLYDTALFFTDDEYEQQYKGVQTAVEKPFIYIFARCPPTDEQIKYTQTRVNDLKELHYNLETEKGDVTDVMRFFHGDSPACSFEIGHQKGENYFCWDCGIFAEKCNDITYAYYTDCQSIQSRLDKIKETTTSQEKRKKNSLKL